MPTYQFWQKTPSPQEAEQVSYGAVLLDGVTQRLPAVDLVLVTPPLPMAGDYTRLL